MNNSRFLRRDFILKGAVTVFFLSIGSKLKSRIRSYYGEKEEYVTMLSQEGDLVKVPKSAINIKNTQKAENEDIMNWIRQ